MELLDSFVDCSKWTNDLLLRVLAGLLIKVYVVDLWVTVGIDIVVAITGVAAAIDFIVLVFAVLKVFLLQMVPD